MQEWMDDSYNLEAWNDAGDIYYVISRRHVYQIGHVEYDVWAHPDSDLGNGLGFPVATGLSTIKAAKRAAKQHEREHDV